MNQPSQCSPSKKKLSRVPLKLDALEPRIMLSSAPALFVDDDAQPGGDGLAWGSAYNRLQHALTRAEALNTDADANNDIDAIWIAEGTYKPSSMYDPFSLLDGVTLYGGFAGTETTLDDRDWLTHVTTLSGSLGQGGRYDDADTVVYCSADVEAVLDGVSITRGFAQSFVGGGIRNEGTLTVMNSTVSGNQAELRGGGIYNAGTLTVMSSAVSGNSAPYPGDGGGICNAGTLTLTSSTVSGNSSQYGDGGGIYNSEDATLTVTNCTVSGNSAPFGDGGGIFGLYDAVTVITNSTFSNNSASRHGGGIYDHYGTLTVTDSTFSDNSASNGGGVHNLGTLTVTNSTLSGNKASLYGGGIYNSIGALTITNSTLSKNSAAYDGGGIYNQYGTVTVTDSTLSGNRARRRDGGGIYNDATVTVTNSTLSSNRAAYKGGGICSDGTLTVTSSTLSGNVAGSGGGGIYNDYRLTVTNSTLSKNSGATGGGIHSMHRLTVTNSTLSENSAVAGGGGGVYSRLSPTLNNTIVAGNATSWRGPNIGLGYGAKVVGSHNLIGDDPDPLLGDWTQFDNGRWGYPLLFGSPAIDAGDSNLAEHANGTPLLTDIEGKARVFGDHVDIGAYESHIVPPTVSVEPSDVTVDEGSSVDSTTMTGAFSDADGDTLTLTSDSSGTLTDNSDGTWSWSADTVDLADGPYSETISVTATDEDGAWVSTSFVFTVNNVAPTLTVDTTAVVIDEGTSASKAITTGDVPSDTVSVVANVGMISDSGDADPNTWTWSYEGLDDLAVTEATITATDDDGGETTAVFNLTVNNVEPTLAVDTTAVVIDEGTPTSKAVTTGDVPADTVSVAANVGVISDSGDADPNTWTWSCDGADDLAPTAVTITARDDDGGETTAVFDLTVNNVAPTLTVDTTAVVIDEGASTSKAITTSDVPADTVSVAADVGVISDSDDADPSTWTWSYEGLDDLAITAVTITARDDDGGQTTAVFDLTVNNVAPMPTIAGPTLSVEGAPISLVGSATDPAGVNDTITYDWTVTKDGSAFASGTGPDIDFTPDDNATYVATLTASDEDGGSADVTHTVTVSNVAPTPTITGPTTGEEGTPISLVGSATDPAGANDTITYEWTVTKDGSAFAGGTGPNIDFTPDDNASYVATLTASDEDGGSADVSHTVAVTNVAPTLSLTGDASGVRGQTLSYEGSIFDPGTADTHTTIWQVTDGNGDVVATGSGLTFEFTPAAVGTYAVAFEAADDDGGSDSVATDVTVTVWSLTPCTDDPSQSILTFTGTQGRDKIQVQRHGDEYVVKIQERDTGVRETYTFDAALCKVVVFGQGGDDQIIVAGSIVIPTELHGGAGNDELHGGSGNDLLLGGDGDDRLYGGSGNDHLLGGSGNDKLYGRGGDDVLDGGTGNDKLHGGFGDDVLRGGAGDDRLDGHHGDDVLEGGAGNDRLHGHHGDDRLDGGDGDDVLKGHHGDDILLGRAGDDDLQGDHGRDLLIGGNGADNLRGHHRDDILVAGRTILDNDALTSVSAEWSSSRPYDDRVGNISGTGTGPRLNGDAFLQQDATVFADSDTDVLIAEHGQDWLFADDGDTVKDKGKGKDKGKKK